MKRKSKAPTRLRAKALLPYLSGRNVIVVTTTSGDTFAGDISFFESKRKRDLIISLKIRMFWFARFTQTTDFQRLNGPKPVLVRESIKQDYEILCERPLMVKERSPLTLLSQSGEQLQISHITEIADITGSIREQKKLLEASA